MTIGISAVFDRTTAVLGAHRRAVALPALLPFAASFAQQVGTAAFADAAPAAQGGWAAAPLALSLVSLWGQLAIARVVVDPVAGPRRAIAVALGRLPLAILIYGLVLAALMLLAAPIAGTLAVAGWRYTDTVVPTALGAGAAAFVMAWGLLVTLIALLAGARLLTLAPVVIAERRGLRSIGRAWRLTRGLTARLVGLLLLFGLVATVATLATQTMVGTISRLLLGGDGAVTPAVVLTAFAVAVVVAGLTLLASAFEAVLYVARVAPDGATAAV